ncbi:MAG: hypothetical protein NC915_06050 [Candidatus Omnitrophica bacterium]|nr:hypothetical protein [Candidatus Omnitrophota bacterium]
MENSYIGVFNLQQHLLYAVIRHRELWWNDLYFLINKVEKKALYNGYGVIIYGTTKKNF